MKTPSRNVSAPPGGGFYSVSEKDSEGKVVITARAGRTTVPAKMANLVIRAAMELTGLSGVLAAAEPSSPVAKTPAAKPAARAVSAPARPARVAPAKTSSTKGSSSKGSSSRGTSSKGSSPAAEGKIPAKSPAAAKAAAKKAAGGKLPAAAAAPKPPAPAQSKSRLPEEISEYDKKISRKDTPASMARRFFDEDKKWGYQVEIAGAEVGKLLFERDGVWNLIPVDERLAAGGVKATDHANPISAYVRVTNAWSRALMPAAA